MVHSRSAAAIVAALILFWGSLFGGIPPAAAASSKGPAEAAYCSRTREDFLSAGFSPSQRLSFGNTGGIAHGGVCWWHSRFQRAAIYLTIFRPDLPKPSHRKAVA